MFTRVILGIFIWLLVFGTGCPWEIYAELQMIMRKKEQNDILPIQTRYEDVQVQREFRNSDFTEAPL
jgi:hypothetical protein